jgi:hypothetical protein
VNPIVLYDACADRAPVSADLRVGAAGLVVGALLVLVAWQKRDRGPRILALLFVLAWLGGAAWNVRQDRARAADACRRLSSPEAHIVSGPVRELAAAPADGRGVDTFEVGEVRFVVDPKRYGVGLTRTSASGGPIREGLSARITYAGDVILRVEALTP